MNLWSISFSYRLGLGFHALNNEGADGSNLMQPRRIDVGSATYDGISGEIIRRHILENFVNICQAECLNVLPMSAGLHPDRGPIGIRVAAKKCGYSLLSNEELFPSVRQAVALCSVLDVGGYLAAWKEQAGGAQQKEYVAEKAYIDRECASYKDADPVKRESCFDVAWLISEAPQDLTITQHSAFRDTFAMNSRYAQTMRSNVYAGVIRADLHRIGTDDYWYLQSGNNGQPTKPRLAIGEPEQRKRQRALVKAIANFVASPTGARVAGWAPHVFLTEGAILLSSARTAPFASPIKVNLAEADRPVQPEPTYVNSVKQLANDADTWVWSFSSTRQLLDSVEEVLARFPELPEMGN
jgi:CRISPR-associated autoregulator DevR family